MSTTSLPTEIIAALRCPRCRTFLLAEQGKYRCASSACASSAGFLQIDNQPILVDSETSILSAEQIAKAQGSSPIHRRKPGLIDTVLTAAGLTTAHASRRNCAAFLRQLPRNDGHRPVVLIIGGGARGAGTDGLYESGSHTLLAFDIYASADTHFVADSHAVPLADASIDGVWIQAVLEHVVEPQVVVAEIHRILKHRGVVYSEIPFMQQIHEGAYDFTRFTLSGHRYLFREFTVLDAGAHGGPGTQLTWAIDHFVRSLFRSRIAGKLAKLCFVWLAWFDHIASRKHSVDGASATFFMGKRSEDRIGHRDAVAFYKGAQ